MIIYIIAELIICGTLGVTYPSLMHCYEAGTLNHLTAAEYYRCSFSAGSIPMVSFFIAVLIICYMKYLIFAVYAVLQSY